MVQQQAAPRVTDVTIEHALAHLARLDLSIRREVLQLRQQGAGRSEDEFRGLYVSDADVDALLDRSLPAAALLGQTPAGDPLRGQLEALDAALAAVEAQIAGLEAAARAAGDVLRLDRLRRLFGLTALEQQVLLVGLAAEVDLKYERLFAYLQDDVTKKRPTVDLVLRLLSPGLQEGLALRRRLEPGAPLLQWELVTLHDDPGARHPVLLARYLKLDERVAAHLLGSDAADARLGPLQLVPDSGPAGDLPAPLAGRLPQWSRVWGEPAQELADEGAPVPVVLIHGRYGSGKRAAAAALAAANGRPLLLLDATRVGESGAGFGETLRLAEREALLSGAVLCWWQTDAVLNPEPGREGESLAFVGALARGRVPTVLLAERHWEPGRQLERRPFLRLELPEATYEQRREIWAAGLNGAGAGLDDAALSALVGRFRLSPGQIQDALERARTLAWSRDPVGGQVSLEDVDAACRTQAQHRLNALTRKLTPRYSWDDIVLPPQQLGTLKLICSMIRQRPVVYGAWGFDRKLAMGKGVITLFAGPSGTGKTMAAEIIARDLGLDVFKIDLSAVVNKYIGETEKNLERLFGEAQDSDAILFFDEADALFGKRSGVSDAHDRYANIETAYLLQRTEEYNGLVILASNLPKNMDDAFVRRLHFTVTFPVPEEAERLEIWRRTFPPEAPIGDDLDLPFLARKLKITGGNVRNIILAAAFVAAEERKPISMRHLVVAAGQEFQKMGKLLHESDFEHYFRLVRV